VEVFFVGERGLVVWFGIRGNVATFGVRFFEAVDDFCQDLVEKVEAAGGYGVLIWF
jgi:hypothetical protein